uniref:NADH dehydrogenase subunit 6 n=1 Tax=Stachybotrys chartarum TaxID=74722 RepID=UPI001EDD1D24|nr:NADH dehydrogenase subunit 6 [Stachybotrys chartarum]UIX25703.1 NADH dehydrogenase subunit 6 [Stachybotrys chartarum]UIX25721.1 NADH dehydrogenase subunit 6 [Stachybotrys chartarum]UIX25739.1 NADH dehydrogenase subunit 6 [Stachybotrys chartarum]
MALLSGILVISIKNPINALICLIALFGIISVYLIFCGLDYIGFSYLIVYIGAVSILFLFILMLISIRTSELQSNNSNSIPLGLFTLIILDYILIDTIPYNITVINSYMGNLYNEFTAKDNYINSLNQIFGESSNDKSNIMYITSNSWDGNITETGHITAIGDILYTSYNIWLLLASLILLLAMVGSIIITIKQEDKKG